MGCAGVYIRSIVIAISRSHAAHPFDSKVLRAVPPYVRHKASASHRYASHCAHCIEAGLSVRVFGFAVYTTCPRAEGKLIGRLYDYSAMAAPSALNLPSPHGPTFQPYAIRTHI
jgi:hypothetical protein